MNYFLHHWEFKRKNKFYSRLSYQDVPFKKKTRFNGDADAGLAITLNITARQKQVCQTTSFRTTEAEMIIEQSSVCLILLVWL